MENKAGRGQVEKAREEPAPEEDARAKVAQSEDGLGVIIKAG
jgi:hypothetical protein